MRDELYLRCIRCNRANPGRAAANRGMKQNPIIAEAAAAMRNSQHRSVMVGLRRYRNAMLRYSAVFIYLEFDGAK